MASLLGIPLDYWAVFFGSIAVVGLAGKATDNTAFLQKYATPIGLTVGVSSVIVYAKYSPTASVIK